METNKPDHLEKNILKASSDTGEFNAMRTVRTDGLRLWDHFVRVHYREGILTKTKKL